MRGILADNDVAGQVATLLFILEGRYWGDLWKEMDLTIHTFEEIGLTKRDPDSLIWRRCQELEIVLITANRNADGPESLEVTIRRENEPNSLPVLTLSDSKRIESDREYSERTAVAMVEYLFRIDTVRGAGRLFLP
jgi:hypothetical protein